MAGTSSTRALTALALAGAAIAAGAASAAATDSPAAAAGGGGLALKPIARFDTPVHVATAPRKGKLLFVVEQGGTIETVRNGKVLKHPLLDISRRVRTSYEEGLLSVAFHPAFKRTDTFFAYYVNRDSNLQVDTFRLRRGSLARPKRIARRKLIVIPHPGQANHNGGQLQFGPDGMLYIGTGDGGGAGDPGENAQDPESLLGKLLRIEPRRRRGYSSPGSNPFAGGAGRDEIYSLGLRNPFRFSFDRANGHLTIGDVGQSSWEEIDHLPFEAARAANFGWDNLEGNHFFEAPGTPPANYVAPIHEYTNGTSVIAGYVVRDAGVPALQGRLVYADLSGGEIRSLDPDAPDPSATDAPTGLGVNNPTSFGEGPGGKVYVAEAGGQVSRIVAR
jgi:glucose/arabinose dehydrogenase